MGHFNTEKTSRFSKTPREWLTVGSQINDLVNAWADRSDIITYVGAGAGHGAPACFVPAIAEMEVDVSLAFGEEADPAFIPDLRARDAQLDYPVAVGAVLHEAMHARFSDLSLLVDVNEEKDPFVRNIAMWLEESRIEARGVRLFPKNRAFLRACALHLVIGDLDEDTDFAENGIQSFSKLMLLTLARVDAGVLDKKDVSTIQEAAERLFKPKTLRALRSVWKRGLRHTENHDGKPLLDLAREWVKILEDADFDPKSESPSDEIPEWLKDLLKEMMGSDEGDMGEGGSQSSGGSGGLLADMAEDIETSAQSEANSQAIQDLMEEIAEARAKAASESKEHKDTAKEVFSRGTGPGPARTSSVLSETRDPSPQERAAAVALGKEFDRARYRDRVVVKRSSVIPPGRLNVRRALAAAEQKSRGAEVTAEAWSRKQRFHTEDPDLTVGVLVDISGSMGGAMSPMASAAWILSEATRRVQGKCAMVYYGNDVFPTLKPGEHMPKVKVYSAPDGTEKFDRAFKALDGTLNLLNSSGARLLVIVSDLYYTGHEGERTKYWMKRCREAGIAVIVIPFDYDAYAQGVVDSVRTKGIEVIPNSVASRDIVSAAKAIGAAAVKQLESISS